MTVAVNWTLPTQRTDGTALPASAIASTRFSLSFNGGAFAPLIEVPAPNATTTITQDLAPGSYVIRAVAVDRQNPARLSTHVDTPFVVPQPVLAAPRPVSGLTAVYTP